MSTRQPKADDTPDGMGVDKAGGPVVDPTKNVDDLVEREAVYRDGLRAADNLRHDDLRHAESRFQTAMREAEIRRVTDLAALKQMADKQVADILTVQVKTTSELISTQLTKETTSLSNQIATATATFSHQIGDLRSAIDPRITTLERFMYEVGGKTSVSDPATADALHKMAIAVQGLTTSKDNTTGQGQSVAWIVAGLALLASIASPIIAVFALRAH